MSVRVLYLIDTLAVGGAERSLLALLPRLNKVEPVVCHLYATATLRDEFLARGVPVVPLGLVKKYDLARAVRAIVRLIQDVRPALIHSTLFRSDLAARLAGRLCRVPVVNSWVADSYSKARMSHLPGPVRRKYRVTLWLDRLTTPLAAGFIANSYAIMCSNSRILRVPEAKVAVIYRGRDPNDFAVDEPTRRQTRLAVAGAGPSLLALNVGRLIPEKGQGLLLGALSRLLSDDRHLLAAGSSICLCIAGEGRERAYLTAEAERLRVTEHVRLLGQREDIPRLLAAADHFLFPSRVEGHPGALVEAMFAGLPIVATDIPMHRETLQPHRSGLLVPPDNPEALADAWRYLIRQPQEARRLGDEARRQAHVRFAIARVAEQYEAYYTDLLAMEGRR